MEHLVCFFERLRDVHDLFDVVVSLYLRRVDLAGIADETEDYQILTEDGIDLHSVSRYLIDKLIHLDFRCIRFENDYHKYYLEKILSSTFYTNALK